MDIDFRKLEKEQSTLRMPKKLQMAIKGLALEKGMSFSRIVCEAIERYVQEEKKGDK